MDLEDGTGSRRPLLGDVGNVTPPNPCNYWERAVALSFFIVL